MKKVLHAGYYMVGIADTWYTEYIKGRLDIDWECFCVKLLQHFTNPFEKDKNAPCQVSRPSIAYFGHKTKNTSGTQSFCKSHASGLLSSKMLVVKAMSALNIFESCLRCGKFDESRVLPDCSLMERMKDYPWDAVYDSMEDVLEVNWKNSICGTVPIVTERIKDIFGLRSLPQLPSTYISFLGSSKNGETFLHPLVFCTRCSKGRCLLPVNVRERNPQRVCDACYDRFDLLQGVLINTVSNVVQAVKHDVMDWTSSKGWLNLPAGFSIGHYTSTQHFSESNLWGKSKFSAVYKGVLKDGSLVAVKSISKTSCKAEEYEFLKGLSLLNDMKHENLVKLKGFCCSKARGECFLMYDFACKGNLSQYLDVEDYESNILDWPTRVSIIIEIAKGVKYLHNNETNKPPIIHQNISVEKVVLDQHFNPLIVDSGLLKLLADDVVYSALKVSAALGYMAPEYITTGRFTEKSDVYAFGVIILQLLSGKRVLSCSVRIAAEVGEWEKVIDTNLKAKFSEIEAARLVKIASDCIHELLFFTNLTREITPVVENPIKRQLILFATYKDSERTYPVFVKAAKAFKRKLVFVYMELDNEEVGKPVSEYFGVTRDAPRVLAYTGNDDGRKIALNGELIISNVDKCVLKLLWKQEGERYWYKCNNMHPEFILLSSYIWDPGGEILIQ